MVKRREQNSAREQNVVNCLLESTGHPPAGGWDVAPL